MKRIIRNIFGIFNEKYHKVICIFGIKIKFFSSKKYSKYKKTSLNKYARKNKLSTKAFESLCQRIENLETKGFLLQSSGKNIVLSNKKIKIATDRYAWIAQEVFYDGYYEIETLIDKKQQYCVLDIGANRCYTAIYFADKKWIKSIDSFEIIPETFNFALENISLNKKRIQNKIRTYNVGLGSETKKIEALYLPNRDGISTINFDWINSYAPNAASKGKLVLCELVEAAPYLKNIIEKYNLTNIILKIDAEGAEYDILQNLANKYPEIFEKTEIMIGDTHTGFDKFLRIIAPFNYKIVEAVPDSKTECVSFTLVKNR